MNDLDVQKEMFIATMVHDLKNPLLAQISCLEQLQKGIFQVINKIYTIIPIDNITKNQVVW